MKVSVIALALVTLLGACGPRIDASVTTFHALQGAPVGKTFIMVPDEKQAQSLEWKAYSDLVAQRLEEKGMRRVARGAEYAVFMRYAVDGGRTTTDSVPIYGQTSSGGTSTTAGYIGRTPVYGSTYTPATYGVVGVAASESTTYARALKIWIYDVNRIAGAPVYEVTTTSGGSSGALAVVMPAMIDATFIDWPQPSGSTKQRVVSVK